jgi:hypothetical protein
MRTHPDGRHTETARARIAELDRIFGGKLAAVRANGYVNEGKRTVPLVSASPRANPRWPSADEPFVGSGGPVR